MGNKNKNKNKNNNNNNKNNNNNNDNHLLAKGMTGALLEAAQKGELKASCTFTWKTLHIVNTFRFIDFN